MFQNPFAKKPRRNRASQNPTALDSRCSPGPAPAAAGLVHRTDKTDLAAVRALDHTGLAVHETHAVRRDPDHLPVSPQEIIQTPITVAVQQCRHFNRVPVPAAEHSGFAQLGDFQIVRMEIDVANDFDIRDRLEPLLALSNDT